MATLASSTDGPAHHIFVDFENVPTVDLALVADHNAHVTLLIGDKQKRLDLPLVRQIHRHASRVTLIEVGGSGRNALDLVLACHLGQAVVNQPGAVFHIVSKDKDFNPLVAHLRAADVNVTRHDAFAALPFLQRSAPRAAPDDRLGKLIDRLSHKTIARPVRRKTLLSHIQAFYANRLSPDELEAVVAALEERGVIAFDEKGRVNYH